MELQTSPEVGFNEVDVLWVINRSSISQDGILKWANKPYYFHAASTGADGTKPVTYLMHALTDLEFKREISLHKKFCEYVNDNQNYLGNMRVVGPVRPSKTWMAYYNLVDTSVMKKNRDYGSKPITAWFIGSL